jgi:predicted esterase
MEILTPTITAHGRVLVERGSDHAPALVGFHGYAQNAEDMLAELRLFPGLGAWTRVSVQAPNRFYAKGDSKVVASWMTRQNRDLVIADNIAYVRQALVETKVSRAVFVGFSQGVAMAYRAALRGGANALGVIALAGDIPPELKDDAALAWPSVLVGVGDREEWYSAEKLRADEEFLASRSVPHRVVRFSGGHEWTDEFRAAAAAWALSVSNARP